MLLPSGDQDAWVFTTLDGERVRRRSPVPSAVMTYSSPFPWRELSKTSRRPSGDQDGLMLTKSSGAAWAAPCRLTRMAARHGSSRNMQEDCVCPGGSNRPDSSH